MSEFPTAEELKKIADDVKHRNLLLKFSYSIGLIKDILKKRSDNGFYTAYISYSDINKENFNKEEFNVVLKELEKKLVGLKYEVRFLGYGMDIKWYNCK